MSCMLFGKFLAINSSNIFSVFCFTTSFYRDFPNVYISMFNNIPQVFWLYFFFLFFFWNSDWILLIDFSTSLLILLPVLPALICFQILLVNFLFQLLYFLVLEFLCGLFNNLSLFIVISNWWNVTVLVSFSSLVKISFSSYAYLRQCLNMQIYFA